MGNGSKGGFEDFIHSRAMLTPGIAGGLVTGITATLSGQFRLPVGPTALVLSFFVALVVFGDTKVSRLERLILYVLNSLIVFSMSVGTNNIGAAVTEKPVEMAGLASAGPATMTVPPATPPGALPTPSPTPAGATALASGAHATAAFEAPLFKPWFQEVKRPPRRLPDDARTERAAPMEPE